LHLEALEDRCVLSSYTTGPLTLISSPDPLSPGPSGFLNKNVAAEPHVVVNPANPRNIAAIWIDHGFSGDAVGVTLDGGQTWQTESLPGTTKATNGDWPYAADPWLAFAPNGDLYAESFTFMNKENSAGVLINKSTDGGLTWSNPIQVNLTIAGADKPSIAADPTHPGYVYAVWGTHQDGTTKFTRTVDGGQTWEPARTIHSPLPPNDFNWGHQIVFLPDGTLVCAFTEGETATGQMALTLLRSSDQGQTWSGPISAVVQQPLIDPTIQPLNATVTDPDTGHAVEAHPFFDSIAVGRKSGNLYAVWLDGRFSNFQYNSIALSMSTDGGFTWSRPIQVNQTPNSVPPIDRQAWNPTVAVAADGTVAVSYYDFRNNTPSAGALTDYWVAYSRPSAGRSAPNLNNWNEVRLTDTSFDLEQADTRFNGAYFLGDYDGLAAVGNDFVAVWGMPDGTANSQESIFFRRAISSDSMTTSGAVAASAGNTNSPGAAADPTLVALQAAAPAVAAWPGQQQAAASLLPLPTLPSAVTDLASLRAGQSGQARATSPRAAAHGTPSTVLDRVFVDLDASLFADAFRDSPTPGPTG
jgi:hypothetical protein